MKHAHSIILQIRPYGQAVKTTPSHGVNSGSSPDKVTILCKTACKYAGCFAYFYFLCINIQLLLILFCVLGQVLGQFFFNKQTFPLLLISIRLINPYKHFQEFLNCALQTLSLRVPRFRILCILNRTSYAYHKVYDWVTLP